MNKNVHIYQPIDASGKRSVAFYANFRVQGKHVNRSTGCADRKTAQAIANKMRSDALLGFFDATPKLHDLAPTCGQLVDRYLETTAVRSSHEVIQDFLTVVAEGAGVKDRAAARAVRLSALTAEAMMRFRDFKKSTRSVSTTNALMRSAKSIFSGRAREHYRGHLVIPGCVKEWGKVSFLVDKRSSGYRRIAPATLERMDKRAAAMLRLARRHTGALRNEWRNAWATYWLIRRCGLRNSEVSALRWEWFSLRENGIFLEMVRRPYWNPKGSEGEIPVARDLYQQLAQEFRETRMANGGSTHVLAGSPTDRWEGSARRVNEFVRRHLPDRQKGAYELRKQWGSEMALRYGIERAARLLRHQGIQTAWKHYIDMLNLAEVQPL